MRLWARFHIELTLIHFNHFFYFKNFLIFKHKLIAKKQHFHPTSHIIPFNGIAIFAKKHHFTAKILNQKILSHCAAHSTVFLKRNLFAEAFSFHLSTSLHGKCNEKSTENPHHLYIHECHKPAPSLYYPLVLLICFKQLINQMFHLFITLLLKLYALLSSYQ